MSEGPTAEMPRYKCHKEVHALKIREVQSNDAGGRTLLFEDAGFAPRDVDANWVAKHEPEAGGYYVVYEDGYSSFSPGEAFEKGYTRI